MSEERKSKDLACNCKLHHLTPEQKLNDVTDIIGRIKDTMYNDDDFSSTSEEYSNYFSCLCSQTLDDIYGTYGSEILVKFHRALKESINIVVIPALEGRELEDLLRMLLEMWNKYTEMSNWLVKLCLPFRTYYHLTKDDFAIEEIPATYFANMVIDMRWTKVQDAITLMMSRERDGWLIPQNLLKRTVELFMELQKCGCEPYCKKLEQAIIVDIESYFSNIASEWLLCCTFGGYLQKAEHVLKRELRQKQYYLQEATLEKVSKAARSELYDKRAKEVAELIPCSGLGLVRLSLPKK